MAKTRFENLRVYQISESLADEIWEIVIGWDNLRKIRSAGKLFVPPIQSGRTSRKAKDAEAFRTTAAFVK
jgi:hypothetical protein